MIIRFTLQQLEEKSKNRPQGYKEEILNLSKRIDDNVLELSKDDFEMLAKKYRTPSFPELVKNISDAAIEAMKGGFKVRSATEIEHNLSVCIKCPYLVEADFKCGVCGCFAKKKVIFQSWKCPLNKWE